MKNNKIAAFLLSRAETRLIRGGVGGKATNVYCCTCTNYQNQPTGGAWTYTNPDGVPGTLGVADIGDYCPTGFGYCSSIKANCPL
jgi:hypothetical protein